MVFIVQVNIEDPDLLENYARIIKSYTEEVHDTKSHAVTEFEKRLAQTLFKGKTITAVSGRVGPPDWWVTEQGVKNLFRAMSPKTASITSNFAKWVGEVYEDAVAVEGKIRQTTKIKDVKIGNLTLIGQNIAENTENQNRYGSGDISAGKDGKIYDAIGDQEIIDVTRYKMIDQLRNRWANDPALSENKGNLLSDKAVNKSKVAKFVKYINDNFPDMAKDLAADGSLRKIRAELDRPNPDKEKLKIWINTVNNRYARMTFLKELNSINKSNPDALFNYISKTPLIKDQFYQKSKNMALLRMVNGKATALLMTFSPSDFNSNNFGARWDQQKGTISIFIKSSVEEKFLSQYADSSAKLTFTGAIDAFNKSVDNLIATKNVKIVDGISFYSSESLEVPHTNSIPMSRAMMKFSTETRFVDPSDFLSKKNQALPEKFDGMSNRTMGTFLSSEYLRLLVIKNIVNKMPVGPVGGPPLRDDMLTYRTGRFANSVQLMIDYRKRLVRYYYNPIYYIHERTSRNPKVLIENSISEVLKTRFKQVFNISEVGRF